MINRYLYIIIIDINIIENGYKLINQLYVFE